MKKKVLLLFILIFSILSIKAVYADSTPPQIEFISPTDSSDTHLNRNWSYVNVSITDVSNTSSFIDWNRSLVGYWSFDWYNSSGVYDNSTWNKFGTFEGGLGTDNITVGKYGNASTFNATDYLEIPDDDTLDFGANDSFTIEMWVKSNEIVSGSRRDDIFSKYPGAAPDIKIYVRFGQFRAFLRDSNNKFVTKFAPVYPQNDTWYHLALVRDVAEDKLLYYINTLVYTSTDTSTSHFINLASVKIGESWRGEIDEVRIYDRALSSEEINASYNSSFYRLYHNFTNVADGSYEYYTYSIDTEGNANQTETRTLTIDTAFPQYFDNSVNSTLNGTTVEFRLRWTDDLNLSSYIFSFDNCTGTLVNDSTTVMIGTGNWSNVTKMINSTLGCNIRWQVYANDTSNNWNTSAIYSFTTSSALTTMNLSSYDVWWNDSVTAYGTAFDADGNPVANNTGVNLTISDRICNNVTDASGSWRCTFNAPNELGTYLVYAKIGDILLNTTTLTVKPKYGNTPIGTIERVVYEQPMMIQDLSGRIIIAWIRIMAWRG